MKVKAFIISFLSIITLATVTAVNTTTEPSAANKHGNQSVQELIQGLKSDDGKVKRISIIELGKRGDKQAVDPLLKIAKDDNEVWMFQRLAMNALAQIGGDQVVQQLKEIALDTRYSQNIRGYAVTTLTKMDPKDLVPFLTKILEKEPGPSIEVITIKSLADKGGSDAANSLLSLLKKDTSNYQKTIIISYLGKMKADQAVEPLHQLLGSLSEDQKELRLPIIQALSVIGDPRSKDLLAKQLEEIKDPQAIVSLLTTLSQFNDPKIARNVLPLLKNENESIRLMAIYTLGGLGNPAAAEPIIELYDEEVTDLSGTVTNELLPNLQKASLIINALRTIYPHAGVEVYKEAAMPVTFGEGTSVPFQVAHSITQLRQAALEAMIEAQDPALASFILENRLADDEDPVVRAASIKVLGAYKDKSAYDAIVSGLEDQDPMVRWQAAWALGQLKDPKAATPLKKSLEDSHPQVVLQAKESLKSLGIR